MSISNDYFITKPGREENLIQELNSLSGENCEEIHKEEEHLVRKRGQCPTAPLTFALQSLPKAILIPENSISKQAQAVVEELARKKGENSKWDIHVYALTEKYGIYTKGRSEVLQGKLKNLCQKSQAIKVFGPQFNRTLERSREQIFTQVLILPDRQILLSHLTPQDFKQFNQQISPFVGGVFQAPDDPSPPSRAFKKLVEAQIYLGREISPQDRVIDLGASPGGWVHVAIEQGASVTAIDRSPLSSRLMEHPRVTFQKANAFKYQSEVPVDWVLSDVIAYPKRVLELMENWVESGKCQRFIFTIKFQGEPDYAALEAIKQKASKLCQSYYLTQLNANKNEATIMGIIKD